MRSTTLRSSQRAPRSCTACSQRKIKCDKKIPCKPCIQKNIAHECVREVVYVRGKATVAIDVDSASSSVDLVKQNGALQQRILTLETALSLLRRVHSSTSLPSAVPDDDDAGDQLVDPQHKSNEEMDLQLELESLNTGATLMDETSGESITASLLRAECEGLEISTVLPSQEASAKIIDISLDMLGWIHCAVIASDFKHEHDTFWHALETGKREVLNDHSWLALYLSILSTGLYFMDDADSPPLGHLRFIQSGSHEVEPLGNASVAQMWYNIALRELDKADMTGIAKLKTVQVVAILTLCSPNFGEFERSYLLLGVAINSARCLQMHRLGSESSYPSSLTRIVHWSTASGREHGRRLWWTLVICDWLGIFSRPASITPSSFDCVLSLGPHDDDVILNKRLDPSIPSPVEYHKIMAQLAYVVYIYFKANRLRSVEKMSSALAKIETIGSSFTDHLLFASETSSKSTENSSRHPWVAFQAHLMLHSFHFLRLDLARSSFNDWLSKDQNQYKDFRSEALDAAREIIWASAKPVPTAFRKPWIVSASTVGAGIFLGLELLCFKSSKTETERLDQLSLIAKCSSSLLVLGESTAIARRGYPILQRLASLGKDPGFSPAEGNGALQDILRYASSTNNVLPSLRGRSDGHSPGAARSQKQATVAGSDYISIESPVSIVTPNPLESELFRGYLTANDWWDSNAYTPSFNTDDYLTDFLQT